MQKFNYFISANFVRKFDISNTNHKQIDLGWFSISHVFITDKIERRKSYGKWFKIQSNKKIIYRQLKFDPTLKATGDNPEINLDCNKTKKVIDERIKILKKYKNVFDNLFKVMDFSLSYNFKNGYKLINN